MTNEQTLYERAEFLATHEHPAYNQRAATQEIGEVLKLLIVRIENMEEQIAQLAGD